MIYFMLITQYAINICTYTYSQSFKKIDFLENKDNILYEMDKVVSFSLFLRPLKIAIQK